MFFIFLFLHERKKKIKNKKWVNVKILITIKTVERRLCWLAGNAWKSQNDRKAAYSLTQGRYLRIF